MVQELLLKRIPRKNIKDFLGKPIIAYSIETAIESGLFDEVMVSTDDDEIAEISRKYGAKTPFVRSKENSDDFATTNDVIMEVLSEYKKAGNTYDYACCIYPTAPFISTEILKQAYTKLSSGDIEIVIPMIPFSFPIQRSFIKNEKGFIEYSQPQHIKTRSQDLPKHYHDVGQFYFFRASDYFDRGNIVGTKMVGIEIDELAAQDIDNEIDWKMAELKYKLLNNIT